MAESAIIGLFAEPLITKLIGKICREALLVTSFRKEFRWLCDELNTIKCFLSDAGNNTKLSSVNNWLEKLQDVLYDAEDLLEECEHERLRDLCFRYQMGRKIKGMKKRIDNIHEQAKYLNLVYRVSNVSIEAQAFLTDGRCWRRSSIPTDSQIVGLETNLSTVRNWLIEDPEARIIAVVGMGGLGKTLLVQHAFNSREVQENFEYLIWLPISQNFSVRELQCLIGRHIGQNLENQTEEEAVAVIHRHLQGRRFLLVLDDVWSRNADDPRRADVLELIGMPAGIDTGSKIVVTTRNAEVATRMEANRVLKIRTLSEEDSWKLFCIHAFRDCNQIPPPDLVSIARDITRRCAQLPLAVKTVAASMTGKRDRHHWKYVLHQLRTDNTFYADKFGISKDVLLSLTLSYDTLPPVLKPCFLYCSVFPEDSEINCQNLIELWIAEGLVSHEDPSNVLAEGRRYLDELIDRCLLEVSKLGKDGRAESCRMHDMVRDLTIFICGKTNRYSLCAGKQKTEFPPQETLGSGCRIISLVQNRINSIPGNYRCPSLRTLLLSHNQDLQRLPSSFVSSLRALRVLDLSFTSIQNLPKCVGSLKHLVHLRLSKTHIEELPETVSGLKRLQLLDLNGCTNLKWLPVGMGGLQNLRHLNVSNCFQLEFLPRGISNLTFLQVMEGCRLRTYKAGTLQLEDLRGLSELQCFSLESDCCPQGLFGAMANLRTLKLVNLWSRRTEALPRDMQAMTEIEHLSLRLYAAPNWICSFQNLTVLQLKQCNCTDFPPLETMPKLLDLDIIFNKVCRRLRGEFGRAKGFPELESLSLRYFEALEELPRVERGAMPRLKRLDLAKCHRLKRLPPGIEWLSSLEMLTVSRCTALNERIKEGGEDWNKIRHCLPRVTIIDR